MRDAANLNTDDIYVLDMSKLKDGDIILEHGYSKYSPIIETVTNCYYTHAMIYLEDTIIEATGDGGVFSRVPNRFSVPHRKDLKVLRLKSPIPSYCMDQIIFRARDLVGSSYDFKQAALAGLKPAKIKQILKQANRYQFCSRLVAQCYDRGGVKLVGNIDYCTPRDIFESESLLEEIIDAVKVASPAELHHAKSGEVHPKHLKCCVAWVREAKKILKKSGYEVQTINEIISATINSKNNKIDKLICDEIAKSGYLDNYLDDKEANPWRYNVQDFSEELEEIDRDICDKIEAEIKKEKTIVNLHCKNLLTTKAMYSKHPIKILKLHLELHQNILLIVQERLMVILKYCSENNLHPNNLRDAKHLRDEIVINLKNDLNL